MNIEEVKISGELKTALSHEGLPIDDIDDTDKVRFLGIKEGSILLGVIGLEIYENIVLLRSLIVDEQYRGKGFGIFLMNAAEDWCRERQLEQLYLLTTNAQAFFQTLHYEEIERVKVPEVIKATSQFSSLCPADATVMHKSLAA